jgi:ubiquitin C-terminal hydrolase
LAVTDATTLNQCLQRHMAPETVDGFKVDDRVLQASLTKRFTYLPRILIIHLKRFDGDGKIDRFIDYPAELNLEEYAVPECAHHYGLFGVCMHHGAANDGHYSAVCEVKGQWHVMDDESVTLLGNINDIIQRDAYVLLYKRL